MIDNICGWIVTIIIVGLIGFGVYTYYMRWNAVERVVVALEKIEKRMGGK